MKPFRYLQPRSLRTAGRLLAEGGAAALAGGTDLLGVLKDEILPDYPHSVVNLKGIPGLDRLREGRAGLSAGALVTLTDLQEFPGVQARYPALAQAARAVGTPQLRNVGTLGGNLCQEVRCWYYRYPRHIGGPIQCARKGSGPCLAIKGDNRYHAVLGGKKCFAACPSDTAVALAALDGELAIAGPGGRRQVPVKDFYTPLGTVLGPGELVRNVLVPRPPRGARQSFLKFAARDAVDFAVASVAALVVIEGGVCVGARISLGAVAPMPVRAQAAESLLLGNPVDERWAERAAEAALSGARPLSGNAYKVEITRTLVKRALLACASPK